MPDIGTILMLLTSGAATAAAGQAKSAVDQAVQDTYHKLKEASEKTGKTRDSFGRSYVQRFDGNAFVYKVHFPEICDEDQPHLMTHVETTVTSIQDDQVLEGIHQALYKISCPLFTWSTLALPMRKDW